MGTDTNTVSLEAGRARTAKAREARERYSAERALGDPRAVRRSVRIVRAAIDHGHLTLADIVPKDAA
jgi:hypothetical protein